MCDLDVPVYTWWKWVDVEYKPRLLCFDFLGRPQSNLIQTNQTVYHALKLGWVPLLYYLSPWSVHRMMGLMSAYHFLASSFVGTRLEFSTAASFWLLRYIPLLYAFLHTSNGFPHIDLSLSDGKTLLSPHTFGKVCDHHSPTLFSLTFLITVQNLHFFFYSGKILKRIVILDNLAISFFYLF